MVLGECERQQGTLVELADVILQRSMTFRCTNRSGYKHKLRLFLFTGWGPLQSRRFICKSGFAVLVTNKPCIKDS